MFSSDLFADVVAYSESGSDIFFSDPHLVFSSLSRPVSTMSRGESRASMGAARQHDALIEFENFKKKFLLANKHITKLNSTLSVRIEELNAQISTLYVENLRLRASEIALAAQHKREREISRKVVVDAEAASQNLTKHLTFLRESYNIKHGVDTPPTPPSPRARRPVPNVDTTSPTSPQFRISRPPNIPGIYEDDEPSASSSDETPIQTTPTRKKSKSKRRLSASKLPLPSRGPSPTPFAPQPPLSCNIDKPPKRIPSQCQSGLLTVSTEKLSAPRSRSSLFGSPIRLEARRAEEEEEFAAVHGTLEAEVLQPGVDEIVAKKEKRKAKLKRQRESENEKDGRVETAVRPREKQKPREKDGSEIAKSKQKDGSASRTALQPIDNNVYEKAEPAKEPAGQFQGFRPISPSGRPSQATRRKKSRPQVLLSDSNGDGADADEEYVGGRGRSGSSGRSGWVKVGGRRKALPKRNAAVVAVTAIEDIRRHSLAY